jgi:WD40 repeat protein
MTTGTPLASVAISDDARVVVTAGADGTTRAFDTHGGSEIARATIECPAKPAPNGSSTASEALCSARAVAMSSDGRRVFSAGDDAMLRVFEPLGASDEARMTGDLPVTALALARAGRRLVVASADEGAGARVRVFDAGGWRESARPKPEKPELNGLAVSADGRFVVIASNWSAGPTLFDLDAPQKGPRELGGPSSPYPPRWR